jgi:UDP-hydrolysing UDP-N-acetyl-D-glucosamine 2-epimerase
MPKRFSRVTMPGKRKTIAVVTGNRAESGLLFSTMHAIKAHPKLNLRVIVAGSHMVQGSWREIQATGFTIDTKVRMQIKGQSGRSADTDALGRGVTGFGAVFEKLKPGLVIVLGDRIEVLATACAATAGGYRLAHIHGGDRAEGLADEAIRHAVSKLAQLHFPATQKSMKRLIRMGESAALIHKVGSPAIDGLAGIEPAEDAPELIVMQHPVGDSDTTEASRMRATLLATRGYSRLVMMPNLDPGGEGIRRAIRAAKAKPIEHLPRDRFLSLLKGARVIVGNSSAGLIEAAAMRVPCVNIGPRQSGREKPRNVIDCGYGKEAVSRTIKNALRLDLRRMRHPYGIGQAGQQIANLLARTDLQAVSLRKHNTY